MDKIDLIMATKVIKYLEITSDGYILGLDEVLLKTYHVLWVEKLGSYLLTSLFSSFKSQRNLKTPNLSVLSSSGGLI